MIYLKTAAEAAAVAMSAAVAVVQEPSRSTSNGSVARAVAKVPDNFCSCYYLHCRYYCSVTVMCEIEKCLLIV